VLLHGEPFGRDRLERVGLRMALRLALDTRVGAISDQPPGVVTLLAGALQGDIGVDAQAEELLAPGDAVLQPPSGAARRVDQEEESARIECLAAHGRA
jgi:hypothetical protein